MIPIISGMPGIVVSEILDFPTVVGTASDENFNVSAASGLSCNLPGSQASGDMIILMVSLNNLASTGTAAVLSTPADWTKLTNTGARNYLNDHAIYYRVLSGSIGSSVTVNSSASGSFSYSSVAYLIRGFTGLPEAATSNPSGTGNASFPTLTPSWGTSVKTLWIANCVSCPNGAFTDPSSFTNEIAIDTYVSPSSSNGHSIRSWRRELEASSISPSSVSITGSERMTSVIGLRGI